MANTVEQKVQTFFAQYPQREFTKSQILVHAGEEPAGVFYLLSGRVNQYDISPAGVEAVVNVFQPPAFFPMSWAINKKPNDYFFEANTKVIAHIAPADEVVAFLHQEPDVLFDLLSRVYRGVDGLLRRSAHLMGGTARSRLLFEILNATYRFGEPKEDGALHVPLKEGDLAKHAGMTRETVNRIVQSLKASDIVSVSALGITVLDVRKLEAELGRNL